MQSLECTLKPIREFTRSNTIEECTLTQIAYSGSADIQLPMNFQAVPNLFKVWAVCVTIPAIHLLRGAP